MLFNCYCGIQGVPGAEDAASPDSSNRRAETLKALDEHFGVTATSAVSVRRSAPIVGHMFR